MVHGASLLGCAALLVTALPAQQAAPAVAAPALPTTRILICPDLTPFDALAPDQKETAMTRFVEILRHLPLGDSPARSFGLTVGASRRGPMLLARGTQQQIDVAAAAVQQLHRTEAVDARLQLVLVRAPLAVARAHRLEPGKTVVADAPWSALLRDAAKQQGSVHNLPEVLTRPLVPFARTAAIAGGSLRATGEVVLLGAGELALAVNVERSAARGQAAPMALAKPVFRLAAGRWAMMMAVDGDAALVVMAHCLEVAVAPGK